MGKLIVGGILIREKGWKIFPNSVEGGRTTIWGPILLEKLSPLKSSKCHQKPIHQAYHLQPFKTYEGL